MKDYTLLMFPKFCATLNKKYPSVPGAQQLKPSPYPMLEPMTPESLNGWFNRMNWKKVKGDFATFVKNQDEIYSAFWNGHGWIRINN